MAQRGHLSLQLDRASAIRRAIADSLRLRRRVGPIGGVQHVAEGRRGTGQKVLVVEDDLDNRWVTVRVLSGAGYTPLEAGDGQEAIEIARREAPALILMDLALPRMDGLEATRRIKADPALCHIPVLAVTALTMQDDERRARAAGVDEYVTKPVRSSTIRAMVRRYVGG